MATPDPFLRGYRRFLIAFVLIAGAGAAVLGGWLVWRGRVFHGFLALCVLAFLVLLARGYAQDPPD